MFFEKEKTKTRTRSLLTCSHFMFCCDALDALFIFYYFIDWRWAARRSMRCTCKSLCLFFFFPVSRVATLTGEPFRLYFSFSFCLTYVHLLLLVGIIRRFFFPLSSSFRSPASLCALALSLLSYCVTKGEIFFFSPRLSFCCFYGVTPLSWSRHIHTFRTSTTTTKRVIQIGEQELRESKKKKTPLLAIVAQT